MEEWPLLESRPEFAGESARDGSRFWRTVLSDDKLPYAAETMKQLQWGSTELEKGNVKGAQGFWFFLDEEGTMAYLTYAEPVHGEYS